ncbi:Gpi16p [Sugiyamaella lignohabitans]|uniref:Gpi16p n=1 Tax=Sugiyamaella lignohabitans TaxID=796027 RepID=A0A167DVR7_9ASCO|nr:Gpi16p [Sugiyamaella lignohabitans]ANB13348.1 Gpi16p [Sugiyamaella lignohabitans]
MFAYRLRLATSTIVLLLVLGLSQSITQVLAAPGLTNYTEHLTLQPLPRNSLLTTFTFESYSIPSTDPHGTSLEYAVFPRSLGQILEQSKTQELHLRFSQGWWDAENWGSPPEQGKYSGGLGVELWAWVEGEDLSAAKANWRKLVYTLSGLFCASLNFIDDATTTFPVKSFQPFGVVNDQDGSKFYLMRGALPREPVCTENLTPFIKLLPCKGKAGISSLLDGHKIFDAQWQGMAIDVSVECNEDGCRKKMTQTINAVIDVARSIQRKVSPVPVPTDFDKLRCDTTKSYNSQYHCFPLKESTDVDWLLSDIFGRQIQGSCPLAENEHHISIQTPETWNTAYISTSKSADDGSESTFISQEKSFKLEQDVPTNIRLNSHDSSKISSSPNQPVLVERSFTGHGLERGGIRSTFTNPSRDTPVRFVYFESFPWFMRLYLHTLQLQSQSLLESDEILSEQENILKDIYYLPAVDRKQPSQLEIEMILPPATSASLTYDFDKAHLFIEEYPPDANYGFDIAPGILTTINESDEPQYTIRTTSLLLQLPTPDFSMPYNVIILTGTVMALTFGNIFNLLTKRIVNEEEAEEIASQRPINQYIAKIKSLLEKRGSTNS